MDPKEAKFMEDIYEPLELYRDQLKAAFRAKAEETFAQMEAKPGLTPPPTKNSATILPTQSGKSKATTANSSE